MLNYVTFDKMSTSARYGKPLEGIFGGIFKVFPPLRGLTAPRNRGIFTLVKAVTKTCVLAKYLERSRLVQGSVISQNDTTSEPKVGNTLPGTPVNASMSGGLVHNQGGTVEYIIDYVCHP